MSVGGVGGGNQANFHLDHDEEVGEKAATEDAPGTVAHVGGDVATRLPVNLGPLGGIIEDKAKFDTSKDVNLVIGMAHLSASGGLHRGPGGGTAGDAKGSASVTLPFVNVPSPKAALDAALKAKQVTHTNDHDHHAKAGRTHGEFQDRHSVGASVTSTPASGESASDIGAAATSSIDDGHVFLDKTASASFDATLFHASDSTTLTGEAGTLDAGYDVSAGSLHAEAGAEAKVTLHGADATANASVTATALDATATASYTTPGLTLAGVPVNGAVDAKVHANVSAEAHASGEVAIEPAEGRLYAGGDVGASAVAKIEGSVTAAAQFTNDAGQKETLGSVTGSAYASAGAEAEAHAHIGYDDGTVSFDVGAGAALGLGAGYDLKGSFDVHAAEDAGKQVLEHAGSTIQAVESKVSSVENTVETKAKSVGTSIVGDLKSAWNAL